MALTRREFLTLGGLAAAAGVLAGCVPVGGEIGTKLTDLPSRPVGDDPIWRALSRLTFGPRLSEVVHATAIGLDAWIEEQLAPDQIADSGAEWRVRRFDTLQMDPSLIFAVREEAVRQELQQATVLQAVYSRRQLYEIMVDFWSDHFSISTRKAPGAWLKTIDDRAVIRPHALGQFRDLLWASMCSPAMLVYLDNQANRQGAPNENYARELLELHTLGVGSGYTQHDVQEVARCLTGWTVDEGLYRGRRRFAAEQHDDGAKAVLGQAIPAGEGAHNVERLCALLADHPATAQHIAAKLVRRLVADDPPPALVSAAATVFTQTHGEIKAVLRTILHSAEFTAAPPKYKRPFHFIAGALRQLDAETDSGPAVLDLLRQMGQPLFEWPQPDGYPDTNAGWRGSLLARWQFALRLATNQLPGTRIDPGALLDMVGLAHPAPLPDLINRLATLLLGAPLPPSATDALLQLWGRDRADDTMLVLVTAVLLAGPPYQWR